MDQGIYANLPRAYPSPGQVATSWEDQGRTEPASLCGHWLYDTPGQSDHVGNVRGVPRVASGCTLSPVIPVACLICGYGMFLVGELFTRVCEHGCLCEEGTLRAGQVVLALALVLGAGKHRGVHGRL